MACVFVCDKVRYLDSISSEYRGLSSCAAPGEPAAEHSGYSSGVLSYNLATQGNHSKPQAQAFLFRHDIDKKARQQHSVSHVTLYLLLFALGYAPQKHEVPPVRYARNGQVATIGWQSAATVPYFAVGIRPHVAEPCDVQESHSQRCQQRVGALVVLGV